jgi:transcriptional regulator with XRE-family HTH domain
MWNSSGDLLRTWRTQKAEMSLRELAAVTYVSKTTLSDWENDKVEPDLHILERA